LEQVSRLLLPVFFIVVGLSVDISSLSAGDLAEAAAIIVVACAGKLLGAVLPGRLAGLGWRDAGVLGVLMNMRGLTELIVLNLGVSMGIVDGRLYSIMVLMALVTTAAAGLFHPVPPAGGKTPEQWENERLAAENAPAGCRADPDEGRVGDRGKAPALLELLSTRADAKNRPNM
jgi:Kef-type K+ transport system membrane component KefB